MIRNNAWRGQRCFIVGGGESKYALPDWRRIAKHKVITCNATAFEVVSDIAVVIDCRVLEKWPAAWCGISRATDIAYVHPADKLPLPDFIQQFPAIPAKHPHPVWSERIEDGLTLHDSSGITALNLACILGADLIYLLGFDCRPTKDGLTSNAGGLYEKSWQTNAADVYANTVKAFEYHAPKAKAGRRIVNLNPESGIRSFEFGDFEEAVR